MTAHPVIYHPDATREAEAASDWYEERSPQAAEGFQYELKHVTDRIAESPETGPRIEGEIRRFIFRQYPYFLVYRQTSSKVQILAVAHAKRKPGYWRSRIN